MHAGFIHSPQRFYDWFLQLVTQVPQERVRAGNKNVQRDRFFEITKKTLNSWKLIEDQDRLPNGKVFRTICCSEDFSEVTPEDQRTLILLWIHQALSSKHDLSEEFCVFVLRIGEKAETSFLVSCLPD